MAADSLFSAACLTDDADAVPAVFAAAAAEAAALPAGATLDLADAATLRFDGEALRAAMDDVELSPEAQRAIEEAVGPHTTEDDAARRATGTLEPNAIATRGGASVDARLLLLPAAAAHRGEPAMLAAAGGGGGGKPALTGFPTREARRDHQLAARLAWARRRGYRSPVAAGLGRKPHRA
eukprot:jgi/Tetstr1/436316/TSEL_025155.t1